MKTRILLLLTIAIFSSCTVNDEIENTIVRNKNINKANQNVNLRINHFQSTGMAVGPVLTLLVQEGANIGTDTWTKFYSNIEGFNYEPGKIYNLSITKETIENPPADGSSIKYILQKIVSTEIVDPNALFNIDLKIGSQSFVTKNPNYKLLDQIKIDCDTLCNVLDLALQNQDFVIGSFKRLQDQEIHLVAIQ